MMDPKLWGLDPVFAAKVKLCTKDFAQLTSHADLPGVYFLNGHPIVTVHIVGDTVAVCRRRQLITYEVDDGRGVISCVQWRNHEDSDEGLYVPALGELVSVQGRISEYRGQRQIKITHISPEPDPNAEPMHWLEVDKLKRTVFHKPFTLPASSGHGLQHALLKDLHTAITEGVLEYMNTVNRPVSLQELHSSARLREMCLKNVGSSCNSGVVEREVATVVASLQRDHQLIPLHTSKPTTEYELLSDEKHLFPIILDYMKRRLRSEETRRLGVPEDWIIQHARDSPALRSVPASRIMAAILKLIDSSQIYTVTAKSYKLV